MVPNAEITGERRTTQTGKNSIRGMLERPQKQGNSKQFLPLATPGAPCDLYCLETERTKAKR